MSTSAVTGAKCVPLLCMTVLALPSAPSQIFTSSAGVKRSRSRMRTASSLNCTSRWNGPSLGTPPSPCRPALRPDPWIRYWTTGAAIQATSEASADSRVNHQSAIGMPGGIGEMTARLATIADVEAMLPARICAALRRFSDGIACRISGRSNGFPVTIDRLHVTEHEADLRAILEHGNLAQQLSRHPCVVGIEERQHITAGLGHAAADGGLRAAVDLLHQPHDIRLTLGVALHDGGRAIGRAVIHHRDLQQLERVALVEHAFDRLAHVLLVVVGGDHDAHRRQTAVVRVDHRVPCRDGIEVSIVGVRATLMAAGRAALAQAGPASGRLIP